MSTIVSRVVSDASFECHVSEYVAAVPVPTVLLQLYILIFLDIQAVQVYILYDRIYDCTVCHGIH